MTDRGVSEVLGFALVFATVVGMIGIVYATGLSGLEGAQEEEKFSNVERAFDVLADNVEDVHRGGAPSRATEIKLSGGSIGIAEPVTIRVRAEKKTDPSVNATYEINPEPIAYEDDEGTLLYTAGAVLRSESDGSAMLHEPNWVIGSERSVIPQVSTSGSGADSIGGSGKVLVVTERRARSLQSPFDVGSGNTAVVNVTVESPRAESWKRFLEDEGLTAVDADPNDGEVTYQFETETLYVPRTSVDVSFDR